MANRNRRHGTKRDYPRTARLGELFREILAEELRDIDEEWTAHVVITAVEVDADLSRAKVYFDTTDGPEGDETAAAHLDEVRARLRHALATQARARRTPELVFAPDPGVRAGEHIEELLRSMDAGAAPEVGGAPHD